MLTYYYPRTFQGITTALLDLFNDMKVVKYDSSANIISEKTVPITFAPNEKYHKDRIEEHYYDADNVEQGQRYYLQLPRMALVFNGIAYNADRATGTNQWRYWFQESLGLSTIDLDQVISDYQPAPYDFNYTLYIMTDHLTYFSQIIENILPYFNPKLVLRVKEFSFLNIERDLPVSMDGVNPEFSDDLNENDTRMVNASINLTVQGFMYRPFTYSKVIKVINKKYYNYDTSASLESYYTSAYQTSAGDILDTSAVLPLSADYVLSGSVSATDTEDKEYVWFTEIE
jgi:hypothetical protein